MHAQQEKSSTAALSAQEVQARYGIDLTVAEVLRHALRHISLQMQQKINAAALSPMLSEMSDFGIGLLAPRDESRDLDFDAVAMSTGAPAHFVINQYYARTAIEHWGSENFQPGDVVIYNDPFRGGSHVNDIGAVMPIFHDGELIGFAVSITHWIDIGGPIPTGFGPGLQRDVYAEGIRLSPRLLYKGGELVRETVELFTEQTRIPDMSFNDLQVVKAALQVGADMVGHYVDRYGVDAYLGAVQYTLDYSERAVRQALLEIPDGTYHAEDHLDNDSQGEPMLLRCTVRKFGSEIEIDFSGSAREDWNGYACQWSDTVSAAHLGLQAIFLDAVPPNAGAYRPVHVVTPPGSCFHALPPMSTNSGHLFFLVKSTTLVKMALSKADPQLAVGENYDDICIISFAGTDIRPKIPTPFVTIRFPFGPYGGTALGDGCSYMPIEEGNAVETSIEFEEEAYPLLFLEREFVTDTAGAGKHRGGPATRLVLAPLVDAESTYQLEQCRFPTKGEVGGGNGSMASILLHEGGLARWSALEALVDTQVVAGFADPDDGAPISPDDDRAVFRISKLAGVRFRAGDVIALQVAGAGGYGDPRERDPLAVASDVRNEIVSPAEAQRLYGVDLENMD
ncbi:MAG: N-methylhydantoinase B [uncultured Pseudonocardia sp.]|uniref:N-methylhydantoinase B n=1 Tax=uncultured Pseudonocardia sp. TaxID=211455 RepID=A0A6J4ND13_9PSEU|nr:MAG: N-methylhydantoinase B [uncultured Pseudonocardia sp.]